MSAKYRVIVDFDTGAELVRKPMTVDSVAALIGVLRKTFGAETSSEDFRVDAITVEERL